MTTLLDTDGFLQELQYNRDTDRGEADEISLMVQGGREVLCGQTPVLQAVRQMKREMRRTAYPVMNGLQWWIAEISVTSNSSPIAVVAQGFVHGVTIGDIPHNKLIWKASSLVIVSGIIDIWTKL